MQLGGLKEKIGKQKKKKEEEIPSSEALQQQPVSSPTVEGEVPPKEEAPRIRARSKSAFAEPAQQPTFAEATPTFEEPSEEPKEEPKNILEVFEEEAAPKSKTAAELRKELFHDEPPTAPLERRPETPPVSKAMPEEPPRAAAPLPPPPTRPASPSHPAQLGPTGRHIRDYLPPKPVARPPAERRETRGPAPSYPAQRPPFHRAGAPTGAPYRPGQARPPYDRSPSDRPRQDRSVGDRGVGDRPRPPAGPRPDQDRYRPRPPLPPTTPPPPQEGEGPRRAPQKPGKPKEFRDVKPVRKGADSRSFDARDRQGLRGSEDEQQWRKRRGKTKSLFAAEDTTVRPSSLKVRIPISVKDLAAEMKLKASQLISKLFLQGVVVTLNDLLEDETTIGLLGHEFGCEISINTSEEKRRQITDKTIKQELAETPAEQLELRPAVVAFMGHVDHGKTSLIDAIRKSNRAAGEAGAITQHIGAFRCSTPVGDIAILDTPGHEAFSAMRARGADVTDIVVLVVAGDEGLRTQTLEAIQQARAAGVTIVVAINKCDKPNFNAEQVYRQLADQELLPEAWGGATLTVNCSAVTGQGIPELLETLALQAEILELRANPEARARGSVLESEMHKGLGSVATVLVQNGTLRRGDAIVLGPLWGRVKTMHDEHRRELQEAGPSTPVEITGLSGLAEAGQEFIVVKNEREAREIAEARSQEARHHHFQMQHKKKGSVESLLQKTPQASAKKMLNLVLKADAQGSLEALRVALEKITSLRAELNILFSGVGEISESDVQLAAASKAVIVGFHTQLEAHAEPLVKELSVVVKLHNIIYHAVDDVKKHMAELLDKIAVETEKGKALVKAVFKSSQAGMIAGCQVIEGSIHRNHLMRIKRGAEVVWKGSIASLKRVKEDVREVQKGVECGILLSGSPEIQEGDILEAYEVTYIAQEL